MLGHIKGANIRVNSIEFLKLTGTYDRIVLKPPSRYLNFRLTALFKLQIDRYNIRYQVCRLRIMPIPYLQRIQAAAKYPLGRRKPDTCSEELAGKGRQGIIAGIILICVGMLFIRGKIIRRRLDIIPVKRRD
jgi:hypothetical protein